jgi:hypothetical protein
MTKNVIPAKETDVIPAKETDVIPAKEGIHFAPVQ